MSSSSEGNCSNAIVKDTNIIYEIYTISDEDFEFIYEQNNFGIETKVFFFYLQIILRNNFYAYECKNGRSVWKGMPSLLDFNLPENQPSFIDGSNISINSLVIYMDHWNYELWFNGVTTLRLVDSRWGEGWALFTTGIPLLIYYTDFIR